MAFQPSIPEDRDRANSIGSAPSLIPFICRAGESTDSLTIEPATPSTTSPRLLAGETSPISERCLPSTPYIRGACLHLNGNAGSPIQYLPSSRDYDNSHPSLDAHSPPAKADSVDSEAIPGEYRPCACMTTVLNVFNYCFVVCVMAIPYIQYSLH